MTDSLTDAETQTRVNEAKEDLINLFAEHENAADLGRSIISQLCLHFVRKWDAGSAYEVYAELIVWAEAHGLIREADIEILGETYTQLMARKRPI